MTSRKDLSANLARLRSLPGWTISQTTASRIVVTSPRGNAIIPTNAYRDDATAKDALSKLESIGYSADIELYDNHPKRKRDEPIVAVDVNIFSHAEEPMAPKDETTSEQTIFIYPETPQRIGLDELLPPEGEGKGSSRYMIPKVVVTPKIAEAFLERVAKTHNRSARKANIRKFQQLMVDGKFQLTHQGVAFNTRGELSDGQHRMRALLELSRESESSPEIVVDITYNMPISGAFAYDGGAVRSNADHAKVAGIEQPAVVATLVRNLHLYEATRGAPANWRDVEPLTPQDLVERATDQGDELLSHWHAVKHLRRSVPGTNPYAAALWRYLAVREWSEAPVDEFIHGLSEMEWSYEDDARKALYRWIANADQRRRPEIRHFLAHFILTYNDFVEKLPRRNPKWIPKWGIPELYAPGKKTKRSARVKPVDQEQN